MQTMGYAVSTTIKFLSIGALTLAVGCSTNQLGNLEADQTGDTSLGAVPQARFDADLTAACGAGGDAGSFLRAPYLQKVTARSASVLFVADAVAPHVRVTRPDGSEIADVEATVDASASPAAGQQYEADLTDLDPAAVHCYEVIDQGEVLLARTGFATAPAAADATVSFVSFGDLGTQTGDQFAVLDQLEQLDPDFVLANGDVAYDNGTLSDFENNFFAVYAEVLRSVPFFPASGNHEMRTSGAAPFREVFALPENGGPAGIEHWYSFDWGPVHVTVLEDEQIREEMIDWLDRDLAAVDQPWKIVVTHHPPYSSGQHGNYPELQVLVPLFEKHGVDVVFSGHDHDYERSVDMNGVTYVVAGAGGRGTRPVGASTFTAFSSSVSHLVYVTASPDELKMWAVDASGQTFDTLRLGR
jgi:hypothetical protein